MPEVDRRSLLKGAGALVAAGIASGSSPAAWAAGGDDGEGPFPWGVASFDPTAESVIIWTRPGANAGLSSVPLEWVVATDEALDDVVARGEVEALAEHDHCVAVDVEGLTPHGVWWYGFTGPGGVRSPVGRTRTMPAGGVDRLRLGVVSCSRFAAEHFGAYRALADREVDLVLHLGDYIYEDGGAGVRRHEPATELVELDQYRRRYALHRQDPHLQALHARHPMVAVWDDHEVAQDAWRDGAANHDPDRHGPWIDRLVAASTAHEEWLPGRTERAEDGRLKAWRSFPLGDLAEVVVLDTRHWGRDRQPRNPDEVDGGALSILGADQARFLTERLRPDAPATRAPWMVLANQVMFHRLALPVPNGEIGDALAAAGFVGDDGTMVNTDKWDGYPEARAEVVDAIGSDGGVVVLTGDLHSGWAWEGPARSDEGPSMVELVTPSVSTTPLGTSFPLPATVVEAGLRTTEPDLVHLDTTSRGYVLVDLTADRMQGEFWSVRPGEPGSAHLRAAVTCPRAAPMALTSAAEPTDDPEPPRTVAPGDAPTGTAAEAPTEPAPAADGPGAPLLVGGGATVAALAAAAAVALRRRRSES